jgi:hypothetical protein
MSEYHLTPATTFSSLAVQEVREKRRKVLEAVKQRRKIIYTRYLRKLRGEEHTA